MILVARSIDAGCGYIVEYTERGANRPVRVRRERCSLPEGHEGEHIHEPSELRKLGLTLCDGCKQPTYSLLPARWPGIAAHSKALCPACAMRELGV